KAFTDDVKGRHGEDFWEALLNEIRLSWMNNKEYAEAAERVQDKIDYAKRRFTSILDPSLSDPTALVKNGRVNVISLIELTDRQADIAVRFYLEELLDDRKRASRARKGEVDSDAKAPIRFAAPVLAVIEEAHAFISKDEKTDTKYIAAKVAREGRKFGLGLAIVSQRPRRIDPNILSQMGSLAVMKMVQHDDQAQVAAASEALSKEIVEQLPALNPGDAVLVGQWVNLPTFVHIDQVLEKRVGADQHAVKQWREARRIRRDAKQSTQAMIKKGYLKD
ncbi:MAG: ATP-binding protein, partial [Nitrososphaerales archaeon]